jgi:hypothetical protein
MKAEISYLIKLIGDDNRTKSLEPPDALILGMDSINENGNIEFDLAVSADDVEQSFSQVNDARLLFILTTGDIEVKLNADTNPAIDITADKLTGSTKYGIFLLTTKDISKVYLSNPSTSAIVKIKMIFVS